jgi:hypothetical protein
MEDRGDGEYGKTQRRRQEATYEYLKVLTPVGTQIQPEKKGRKEKVAKDVQHSLKDGFFPTGFFGSSSFLLRSAGRRGAVTGVEWPWPPPRAAPLPPAKGVAESTAENASLRPTTYELVRCTFSMTSGSRLAGEGASP